MSVSRRKFLRAGTLAALLAGIPLESALVAIGQENRKERDRNPVDPFSVDSLSYYTKSAFMAYLNSTFLFQAGPNVTVAATLNDVRDSESGMGAAGKESFSLHFKNDRGPALPQGTYAVKHAALGDFALFLVPGGVDKDGAHAYVAVINRLGNSPALFNVPVGSQKRSA
jgi:hypothetical protein